MTTFSLKKWTRFGTWNVRTLLDTARLSQVCNEFHRYKLLFMGLCETRWPENGEFITSCKSTLLFSGRPTGQPRISGVGILLSKEAKNALIEWKPWSDRIITARFKTRARNMTVVQCYAPTENADINTKEDFYNLLTTVIASRKRGDILLLMGDFNAQLGSDNMQRESAMGRHGIGRMTQNGEFFIETCLNNNLVVGGTIFPHKNIHKVTWMSPDNITENQIDHIAISKEWRGSLLDVRNKRGADCASDHHLLLGIIRLKVAAVKKGNPIQRKYFVEKLQSSSTKSAYIATLETILHNNNNAVQSWDAVKQCFTKAAEEHLGYKVSGRKQWISDLTWELITRRKELKNRLNMAKTRNEKATIRMIYYAKDKEVKRNARNDKRKWYNNLAKEAEISAAHSNMKNLYKITKQLTNRNFTGSRPLRTRNGQIVTSRSEQMETWVEHYSSLLSSEAEEQQNLCNCESHIVREDIPISPPELPEIIEAINSLKNNKAPGLDNIQPELLKASPEVSARILFHPIKQFWDSNELSDELKEGVIINIPKKGDLSRCKNWRDITLLSITNKIIAQIINKRLVNALDPILRKEQAGFRPQRSCSDHINSLRIIIEQSVEWRSPLYLTFIDFEKAFDTLAHSAIWNALACKGTPRRIIDIIQGLYTNAKCRILHDGHVSDPINIKAGVRQGCVLSPTLFNIVLDCVLQKALTPTRGITWGLTNRLEDLDYADDVCLLSHSFDDMQKKLNNVQLEASKANLRINIEKTKVIRINTTNSNRLQINNQYLEDVTTFCYLGSVLTSSGGSSADIKNRINAGNQSFGRLSPVWRSSHISVNTKLRIFNSCVKSTLLYGCESWNAAGKDVNAVQVFTNRCLRRILKIFWPATISNSSLWQRTNQTPIKDEILRRKWRWIGHILRKPDGDINKTAIEWNPQGSRRQGRPAHTWRRQVEKEAATQGQRWNQLKVLALDRSNWKQFVMAL